MPDLEAMAAKAMARPPTPKNRKANETQTGMESVHPAAKSERAASSADVWIRGRLRVTWL